MAKCSSFIWFNLTVYVHVAEDSAYQLCRPSRSATSFLQVDQIAPAAGKLFKPTPCCALLTSFPLQAPVSAGQLPLLSPAHLALPARPQV